MASQTAVFRGDLYGRAAIADSAVAYRQIRDLGPAVWSPKRNLWLIGRFDDVRAALRAHEALVSGKGVAANDLVNRAPNAITLTSDDEVHERRRSALIRPLLPQAVRDLRPRLEAEAERLVTRLTGAGTFDAMARLASHLPVSVVAELVGLNETGRRKMLQWAAATFNALGVLNARALVALPEVLELSRYIKTLGRGSVAPDGWAAGLFDAADRGEISQAEAQAMILDYVAPALDTTILATGEMIWRLATSPGAWDAVRATPELVPSVVNESVRLGSPIRGFTRFAAEDYDVDGTVIRKGARALVLFASANRDERRYEDPDSFRVDRNPRDHVGWGHGRHSCAGMHLARLEMEVLLRALVARVGRIEAETPVPIANNVLQGFRSLPVRFH